MSITLEDISKAEEKYTEEMKQRLLDIGATIDKKSVLQTEKIWSHGMAHENLDVVFAVPLYMVISKLPFDKKVVVKNFGVFYDSENTKRYGKLSTFAWLEYAFPE